MADGAPEEELPAAGALDDEPGDGGEDGVDDHVDAAEEEGDAVGLLDGGFEEDGEVVDDGVASADLLHELGGHAEHHAPEVLGFAVGEHRAERGAFAACVAGCPDAVQDDGFLQLGLFAVAFEAAECGDDRLAFRVPAAREEPSRGFREPDHADTDNEGEDDLEGDWEAPCQVRRAEGCTVVDPVGREGAESDDTSFDTNQETTVSGPRTLGLICWDCRSVDAVANAGDDSTDDELSQRRVAAFRGDLDDDAENHNGTSHHHRSSPSQPVAESKDKHCTHQTS